MKDLVAQFSGHVIVVMAPTGSGKGTIINHALLAYPEIYQTVSCTSRSMRPGEIEGDHYHFLTQAEFDQKIQNGDFLEWAEFAGNRYGTLKSEVLPRVKSSEIVLLEIELQGVEQLLKLLPREEMTIVYIEAGGWSVLKERALSRAPMTEAELEKRYERFVHETEAKPLADMIIDNSEDIEAAHAEFSLMIESVYKKCNV